MTSSGFESATIRLVALCLNLLATASPVIPPVEEENAYEILVGKKLKKETACEMKR
jgi:hypothetical protein